jgi:hypothetical protein
LPGYVLLARFGGRDAHHRHASRLLLMHKRLRPRHHRYVVNGLCARRLFVSGSVFDSWCRFGRGVQGRKCLRPVSGLGDRRLNNSENV